MELEFQYIFGILTEWKNGTFFQFSKKQNKQRKKTNALIFFRAEFLSLPSIPLLFGIILTEYFSGLPGDFLAVPAVKSPAADGRLR